MKRFKYIEGSVHYDAVRGMVVDDPEASTGSTELENLLGGGYGSLFDGVDARILVDAEGGTQLDTLRRFVARIRPADCCEKMPMHESGGRVTMVCSDGCVWQKLDLAIANAMVDGAARKRVLKKLVIMSGRETVIACDGRCDKAWGINGRPRRMLSENDPDDYVYEPDGALGEAPPPGRTRGLSEGGDMKPSATPLDDAEQMNRWCARECERSNLFPVGQRVTLKDFDNPKPNKRSRS